MGQTRQIDITPTNSTAGSVVDANHLVEVALGVCASADGEANSLLNLTICPSILVG